MAKHMKSLLLTLASIGILATTVAIGGCAEESESQGGPRFLKGIDTQIDLGDGLDMEDYIEYVKGSDYTITATMGDMVQDITTKRYWQPVEPGVYTVTYTITEGSNKGSTSFDLTVTPPKLKWKYTLNNTIYDTGDTLQFEEYFNLMNIAAQSYYPWEMIMDSVTVGGITTDLTEETEWTFNDAVPHVFKFHIQSQDGQSIKLSQSINVRFVQQDMLDWMGTNLVTVDRALRLESGGKVVLDGGTHNRNNTASPDYATERSLAHLDYNGEYGVNDFLVLDFTGNNMPAMLFFGEEITNSPWWNANASAAENKGLVIANGWTTKRGELIESWHKAGSVNGRLSVYGPTKAYQMGDDKDGFFRPKFEPFEANPASMFTLTQEENINRKMRIIVGFTKATATEFVVSFYMMDRETGETIYDASLTVKNTNIKGNTDGSLKFTDDMFTGKISLYGMFGRTITFDKIYPIEQDTDMKTLKLKYLESPYTWIKNNKVTTHNMTYSDETQKVVLAGGTHNGNMTQGPDNVGKRDMSYVAFNGDYGLNDFVVVDFSGINMPIFSFFNGDIASNAFYDAAATPSQNKGFVLMNGATNLSGEPLSAYQGGGKMNDRFTLYGPTKAYKTGEDKAGFLRASLDANWNVPMGLYTLSKEENVNRNYRIIVGFTAGTAESLTVSIYMLDRDTGNVLYDKSISVANTKIKGNESGATKFTNDMFTGSIVLYSHFGLEMTLDKLYAIEQDTTMSALKTKYAVNA